MEERRVSNKNERIHILISIFEQPFTYYKLNSNKRHYTDTVSFDWITTRDYLLRGYWF